MFRGLGGEGAGGTTGSVGVTTHIPTSSKTDVLGAPRQTETKSERRPRSVVYYGPDRDPARQVGCDLKLRRRQ